MKHMSFLRNTLKSLNSFNVVSLEYKNSDIDGDATLIEYDSADSISKRIKKKFIEILNQSKMFLVSEEVWNTSDYMSKFASKWRDMENLESKDLDFLPLPFDSVCIEQENSKSFILIKEKYQYYEIFFYKEADAKDTLYYNRIPFEELNSFFVQKKVSVHPLSFDIIQYLREWTKEPLCAAYYYLEGIVTTRKIIYLDFSESDKYLTDRGFKKVYVNGITKVHLYEEGIKFINNNTSKKILFTHRFPIRGHWRRINLQSYGKNRRGDRNVKGRTWVLDHIKGSNELPLKKKDYIAISDK